MADLLMQRVASSGRGPDNGHAVSTGKTLFRDGKTDIRGKRAVRIPLRKASPQGAGGSMCDAFSTWSDMSVNAWYWRP